jgi:acetolactate synthase-1/2/3 large subunit
LAIRALCERHGLPALVTYKAKGVLPDHHPWFGGVLTNGALERPLMAQADVLIAVGLDPVELLPRPWTFPQPVVSVSAWQLQQQQVPFAADLVGDVVGWLEVIASLLPAQCDWDPAAAAQATRTQREAMRPPAEADRLAPHRVVEIAAQAWPGLRATVDAGAHMFPVMSLWPAREPNGILISNGLATMGFALPAAIGAALLDPTQPVAAFTGDGGLLMCLGELRTAARENVPLRVLVFNDGNLSLIKIKQAQRGYHTDGVSLGAVDWVALGEGLGLAAFRARDESQLARCLGEAATIPGPALIAAEIDPQTYGPTMKALRG